MGFPSRNEQFGGLEGQEGHIIFIPLIKKQDKKQEKTKESAHTKNSKIPSTYPI